MRLFSAVAVAVLAAVPTLASATAFSINFEKNWSGENGDIANYYNGGRDGDTRDTSVGPNLGVVFVNMSGLSNSAAPTGFPFYSNAPSPLGTAYAFDTGAFLNVASGVSNALGFFYANPALAVGAIKAYSGLNGGGTLLGMIDLAANDLAVNTDGSPIYNQFTFGRLNFAGVARSFDFSGSASSVLFDNIATVPEPGIALTLLAGGAALLGVRRRRVR